MTRRMCRKEACRSGLGRALLTGGMAVALTLLPGCSLSRLAAGALGNALAEGGSTWARDDDPELVRQALPFALKTIESLLESSPEHKGLLLQAASGFTQYAYAFVESDADFVEDSSFEQATELRRRAVRLYLRARGYGLRGLEVTSPGFGPALRRDAGAAAAAIAADDVGLLVWTALPWAAAISLAKEDAELTADLGVTEALMRRALALDEGYGDGAIHDFFIAYEGARPEAAGGSPARAAEHLSRAVELSGGQRAAPWVTYAETVTVALQDRAEFERCLNEALAVDVEALPQQRLANTIAVRRARWLLGRADVLFLE